MAGKIKKAVDSAMSKLGEVTSMGDEPKLFEKIVPIPPIATYTELPFALVTGDEPAPKSSSKAKPAAKTAPAAKAAPAKSAPAAKSKAAKPAAKAKAPAAPKKKAKAAKKKK